MIDRLVTRMIRDAGAEPLFLGYRGADAGSGFPAAACVSVNDEVIHGVPGERVIGEGDLVSVDVGLRLAGWCADMASSVIIGEDTRGAAPLLEAGRCQVRTALALAGPGVQWSVVARALERGARDAGFGIVTEFVGHGIGRTLHELPKAPAYHTGFTGDDFVMEEGMVFTVEPILTAPARGSSEVPTRRDGWRTPIFVREDGWTVATRHAEWSCHEERMLLITPRGAEILGGPVGKGWI